MKEALTKQDHAGALILDFPAIRTVSNTCLLSTSYHGKLTSKPTKADVFC